MVAGMTTEKKISRRQAIDWLIHEIMEEVSHELPESGPENEMYQKALILAGEALNHIFMD